MTQEEKQLLLKDLAARLPYGVVIQVNDWTLLDIILKTGHIEQLLNDNIELKPYLRPLSSMTEEEEIFYNIKYPYIKNYEQVDWLNAHHFDYRNLIEKGLAIAVTEENNPYKE
jgi:hypothetical protein